MAWDDYNVTICSLGETTDSREALVWNPLEEVSNSDVGLKRQVRGGTQTFQGLPCGKLSIDLKISWGSLGQWSKCGGCSMSISMLVYLRETMSTTIAKGMGIFQFFVCAFMDQLSWEVIDRQACDFLLSLNSDLKDLYNVHLLWKALKGNLVPYLQL